MTAKVSAISANVGSLGTDQGEAFRFGADTSGQLAGFRNKLINGDFNIWQRGAGPFNSGGFNADRWQIVTQGAVTESAQRYNDITGNYCIVDITASPVGSGIVNFSQNIEAVRTLAGKKATLTIKTGNVTLTAGKIAVNLYQFFGNGGGSAGVFTPAQVVAVTASGTATLTFDVPSVAGKILGSAGDDYLAVIILISNYTVPEINGQTGVIVFDSIQLEEGSIATPFEQRPIGLELSLCQRYYQPLPLIGATYWVGTGGSGSGWAFPIFWQPMRVNPTVSGSTFSYSAASGGNVLVNGPSGGRIGFITSASGGGTGCAITGGSLSAEL